MKKLHNLDAQEVSLVAEGANKRRFLVYKGKDIHHLISKTDPEVMETVDQLCEENYPDPNPEENEADEELETPEDDPEEIEKVKASLKATARILSPFKDQIPPDVAHKLVDLIGFSKKKVTKSQDEGDQTMAGKSADQSEEKSSEEQEEIKKSKDTAEVEVKKKKKAKDDEEDDEDDQEDMEVDKKKVSKAIAKSPDSPNDLSAFPEAQRPHLEAIFKSNKELIQKNLDLEKQLSTERSERRLKEFIEKANGFKHYVGNKEELAKELMELSDKSPSLYEKIEKQLRSADVEKEAVSKSLFREIGSNQGNSGVGDALSKIDIAVDAIVQKSGNGKTKEQIYTDFIQTPEGQRLYAEHQAGRKDKI